ncbi:F-box family protein [Hibiscus syriacus]|uniref:F-box family protein n=1 Tax=Hibiscus syriacus TaxID=106335 RepID=A0A6A3C0Q9_HIBSY|nr:F-box family protein [Hibiscus syriacus]
MDFTRILPEECQCMIISLTSPADARRSAMVSPSLRSVADSDAVWEKFLPCDHFSILSTSSSSSSSLLSLGKKDLYLHLSSHPTLIQNGTMSFQLEQGTGKKCYRLGARALSITRPWGDLPNNWTWTSLPESRFPEVEFVQVWWIYAKGSIETRILSHDTNYVVYLVFKVKYRHILGFGGRPVYLSVNVDGVASSTERRVSLDSRDESQRVREREEMGGRRPKWVSFFNGSGDGGSVKFVLHQVGYRLRGLIIEGIEIRPKVVRQYA